MRASAYSLAVLVSALCYAAAAAAQGAAETAAVPDGSGPGAAETYITFEKISYNVEKAVHTGPDAGEVTVTLYHAYPSTLHNVRLHGSSDMLDVRVEPAVVAEFKTTLFQSFTVHVSLKHPAGTDRVVLPLAILADEFAGEPTIEVTIPLTAEAQREVNEALALPVGEIELRVTPYGDLAYYGCIVGTLGIIGWLIVRRRRAG